MPETLSKLLNTQEAANLLGISVSMLSKARIFGGGPVYIKLKGRVAYSPADLAAWLESLKRRNTSEIVDGQPAK